MLDFFIVISCFFANEAMMSTFIAAYKLYTHDGSMVLYLTILKIEIHLPLKDKLQRLYRL